MKKYLTILFSVILLLSFSSCGSQEKSSVMSTTEMYAEPSVSKESFDEEHSFDSSDVSGFGNDIVSATSSSYDKIIYSANISIETTSFDDTINKLAELVASSNGYIESNSINKSSYYAIQSGESGYRNAYYTIRIPVEYFNDIISAVSELGNIPYSNIYTDNVSKQYYDTESRLNNYTLQEERLLELLDEASSVSDIIEIESQLSEVRYQIESLQTTLNNLDNEISYSTIYLDISEVGKISSKSPATFGYRLLNSLKNGFDFIIDLALWLVGAIPVIAIIGGISYGVYRLIKIIKSKKKK